MITNSALNIIIDNINSSSCFNIIDFIIENGGSSLEIFYKYNSNYYLKILKKQTYTTVESTLGLGSNKQRVSNSVSIIEYSPSDIFEINEVIINSMTDIKRHVISWLDSLYNELMSDPKMRIITDMNTKLESVLSNLKEFPDEPFTDSEINEWKERLEKLEENIKNALENNSSEQKNLKQEIDKLHVEIEILKSTLAKSTKPKWFKSVATKLFIWLLNPKNQKELIENIQDFKNLIENNHS